MILLEPANTITHNHGEIKRRTISLTGFSETSPDGTGLRYSFNAFFMRSIMNALL